MSSHKKRPRGTETELYSETVFIINDSNEGNIGEFLATHKPPKQPKPSSHNDTKPNKHRNVGSEPREKDAVGLRVIGGTFRGSKLAYAGDNRVRPMKDRVREAVFNLIGVDVRGKFAIDLFAGTGALAIEAISRGAIGATLIEQHFPTARNARNNLVSLNLESKCKLITTDTFFWSHTQENVPTDTAWIVFCSPPYDFYINRTDSIIALLTRLKTAAPPDSLFVIEADNRFDFTQLPFTPNEKHRRSYPPAEVAIYRL
ncbi:MAG: RsmD family RNA methyltransferase [Planctomycetaceae bacterium]|jgi:16S rRNA (guanine966-N2)-methyltransferase|nr:RsmD family RNA methyltransferase [Planctomycetaceae bacterium]